MPAITPFGVVHTLISLVAVVAGVISFFRQGRITWGDGPGKTYTLFTVASCVRRCSSSITAAFGPPHVVAVLTLVVLAHCGRSPAARRCSAAATATSRRSATPPRSCST